jgi:hypothetical protein
MHAADIPTLYGKLPARLAIMPARGTNPWVVEPIFVLWEWHFHSLSG